MKNVHVIEVDFGTNPKSAKETLPRAKVKGWVSIAFWGLRIYIVVMVALVIYGFLRGAL